MRQTSESPAGSLTLKIGSVGGLLKEALYEIVHTVGVREPADMWRRILRSVNSYKDVETPLINSMERLIDFVTVE